MFGAIDPTQRFEDAHGFLGGWAVAASQDGFFFRCQMHGVLKG